MPTAMQPRIIEAPGGGIVRNVDPRHVDDRAWANGRNVRFPTGGTEIHSTDGYTRFDDTVSNRWLHGLWWYVPPSGGSPVLVRLTTHGASVGVGAEQVAIATYSAPRAVTDVVTLDQYQDELIWSDGIELWGWVGVGLAARIEGGAPVGKLVEIHKEHLLIGNLTSPVVQPWRVAYSGVGDPHDFAGDTAGDLDFLDDSTGLTALKVLGDHAIVHKPNRLYRMIFVGPPDQYIQEGIPSDDGALSARSPISIGAYQFYMGRTNFYRLGSFTEPIGDAIWPEIQALIDWPRAALVYAYRRLEWDEICWKIPTRSAIQPSITACYNFRDNTWTLTDHDPGTCFTELPGEGQPLGPDPEGSPVRGLFGQDNGRIQLYGGIHADGAPIHAWAEGKAFSDLAPAKVLGIVIVLAGHGIGTATGQGTLMVSLRTAMDPRSPMPAWPTPRPFPLAPPQHRPWVDVRGYGRLWQVRLDTNTVEDNWAVQAYGPVVIPGGHAR